MVMNLGFSGCMLIGAGILIAFLGWSLDVEKAQNAILRQENAFLDQTLKEEQRKAQKAISEANDRIAQYELDMENYYCVVKSKVKEIDKKTVEDEVEINIKLQQDSSADNQLKLMETLLHDFSKK